MAQHKELSTNDFHLVAEGILIRQDSQPPKAPLYLASSRWKRNRDKLMHTTHLVNCCFFWGWNMMELYIMFNVFYICVWGFGNRLQLVDLSLLKSGCLHGWCVDESPAASSHTDLFQSALWRSRATCLVDESCWVMCSVSIKKKNKPDNNWYTLETVYLLYLVGGLEQFLCSIIYGIILPIAELHHFSRWAHCTTNQLHLP